MKRVLGAFILSLVFFPSFGFTADDQQNSPEQTYGARRQDLWIMDVLGVALRIRKAEEEYQKWSSDCHAQSVAQINTESPEISSCKKAEEASGAAKHARRQYQLILDQAALASVPVEWLRAHFSWVRYGREWDRSKDVTSQ